MAEEESQEQQAEGSAQEGEPQKPPSTSGADQPSEEEIRRQIDEEIRSVRVQDVLLQSVVSLINLSARRIAKEDERDLDQARIGIEAVRAVVDLLDDEPAAQVRNALSEVQMLYAQAAEGGKPEAEKAEGEAREGPQESGEEPKRPQPPGSKLWTPPGT
jgi:hypothetical protein